MLPGSSNLTDLGARWVEVNSVGRDVTREGSLLLTKLGRRFALLGFVARALADPDDQQLH